MAVDMAETVAAVGTVTEIVTVDQGTAAGTAAGMAGTAGAAASVVATAAVIWVPISETSTGKR